MALELKRLIDLVHSCDITLVAGEKGMNRTVSWIHMAEAASATEFLEGDEVVITTGVGLNGEEELLPMVKLFHEKEAAAVMINIGPYISRIPQGVIDYCNEKNLPVFSVPWRVHLSEIMQTFCFALTRETRRLLEISSAFRNAIHFPEQDPLYVVPLTTHDFQPEWSYCAALIQLKDSSGVPSEWYSHICSSVSTGLSRSFQHFSLFPAGPEGLTAVMGNMPQEECRAFVSELLRRIRQLTPGSEWITGVGKRTKSIRCLHKSFHQASSVVRLKKGGKLAQDKTFYEDLGLYKLLMNINDPDIISDFIEHSIGPILEYDEKNNASLADLLRSYLKHNGSVQETADELYIHRNTVNYKLQKIRELTGMDISELNTRLQLTAGLMLLDMQ